MTSLGAVVHASWDVLPAEALERVVSFLTSDVLSLCASACVARAWRDAAACVEPRSAVRLNKLPPAVAQRLTDAGLAALVRRARGRLVLLDLCGAQLVTDDGLTAALLQPHALTIFRADIACSELTASAVTRALEPQRGRVRELSVRGLKCLPHLPDSEGEAAETAWYGECRGVIRTLRALLAPCGTLVGDKVCDGDDYEPCARLCSSEDACQNEFDSCKVALCGEHQGNRFNRCLWCHKRFCSANCMGHDNPTLCGICENLLSDMRPRYEDGGFDSDDYDFD
jgi:hypothetical protein